MNTDNTRAAWIESTARLMRVVDHGIDPSDALVLAAALWERPGSDRESLVRLAEQLARVRLHAAPPVDNVP